MADFLLEIGTEEIPPGYLAGAADDLKERLARRELTIAEFSRRSGIPRRTLSELVNRTARGSEATWRRIEKALAELKK